MKICYIDESSGDNSYIVVVAVMIDTHRMKKTKEEFKEIKELLSIYIEHPLEEIHTTHLYRGLKEWKEIDKEKRHEIIREFVEYFNDRKHKILFTAIDKEKLDNVKDKYSDLLKDDRLINKKDKEINLYRLACLHLALCIQKLNCNEKNNKGNTFVVCDKRDETISDLIWNPPDWINYYFYSPKEIKKIKKKMSLDCIVDIPFFADSTKVLSICIADFYAYFISLYFSLKTGKHKQEYENELNNVEGIIKKMIPSIVEDSNRWSKNCKNIYQKFFYDIAPTELLNLKKI